MNLQLHEYSLAPVLIVAKNLVDVDRKVHKALTGAEFDADVFAAQTAAFYGPSWVAIDEAQHPHAAGGFIQQRPGVFRSWFISDLDCWHKYRIDITTIAAQMIREMLAQDDVRLIETWTLAENVKTRAWYGRIGLSHEATLRGFGASGEDVVIYVVRKGGSN